MLSDILLITEKHRKAAELIAERVVLQKALKDMESPGYRFIVAISGESGAGKSELSHTLALALKHYAIRVKVLHTDNYYQVAPLKRRLFRESHNFEHIGPEEYDRDLLQRNIADFRYARISLMPCIDILTEKVDQLITDFSKVELLIIDGLYAIATEGIDLGVFIDLTYEDTKGAQVTRNKESTDQYRWRVLEKEHESAQKLRNLANTFVDREYNVLF